jgi:hypothetical protein
MAVGASAEDAAKLGGTPLWPVGDPVPRLWLPVKSEGKIVFQHLASGDNDAVLGWTYIHGHLIDYFETDKTVIHATHITIQQLSRWLSQ